MRWHYRDAGLLWLWPPAYAAHLAEELWAGEGFPAWVARVTGGPLPFGAFLVINAIALVAAVIATRAAVRSERGGWIAVALATLFTVNALLHLSGSLWTGSYSPGLITGIVLYVPLGQLILTRAWQQAGRNVFRRGVGAGLSVHAAVLAIALTASSR